nr:hypothetical protein [Tanacetum cinerariifolium]
MTSLEDINNPTEAMNTALILFAKAFQLNTPTNNNQMTSSNPRNRQIAQPVINMSQDRQTQNVGRNSGNQFGQYAGQVAQNQQGYNAWQNGIANQNRTGNVVAARAEAGSKDRPPMLALGNYIQWKSRIKRYIDTKPNRELIHYCLENPPYELGWKDKFIIDAEGNPTTATHQ